MRTPCKVCLCAQGMRAMICQPARSLVSGCSDWHGDAAATDCEGLTALWVTHALDCKGFNARCRCWERVSSTLFIKQIMRVYAPWV